MAVKGTLCIWWQKIVDGWPLRQEPQPKAPSVPRVAAIMDEFTEVGLGSEWEIFPVRRDTSLAAIESFEPEMLFVESVWKGPGGTWSGCMSNYRLKGCEDLERIVLFCKSRGIPAVFWNKEDPPNFEIFSHVAELFDWVFTTAAEMIPEYQKRLGHSRIGVLEFAAQPRMHNPIRKQPEESNSVLFAGSWYGKKHEKRADQLSNLLHGVIASPFTLTIMDRNSGLPRSVREKYLFPAEFRTYVATGAPYRELLERSKKFHVHINVNTVEDSSTMFARRVYELLASSSTVLTGPSKGMEEKFGDCLYVADSATDASKHLGKIAEDPWEAKRKAHIGYRRVMRQETYSQRSRKVFGTVFPTRSNEIEVANDAITVVCVTRRPENLERIKTNFLRQVHPTKRLLIVIHGDREDWNQHLLSELEEFAEVLQAKDELTLGYCLNRAVENVTTRYWAKFDDDDYYGPNYLGDSFLPFLYCNAGVVGKAAYFTAVDGVPGLYLRTIDSVPKIHTFTNLVSGATLVVDKELTEAVMFPEDVRAGADTSFLGACRKKGVNIYSADPFNFTLNRADEDAHTWKISKEDFLSRASLVSPFWNEEFVNP